MRSPAAAHRAVRLLLGGNYDTEFRLGKYLPLHYMKRLLFCTPPPLGCGGIGESGWVDRAKANRIYEEAKSLEVPGCGLHLQRVQHLLAMHAAGLEALPLTDWAIRKPKIEILTVTRAANTMQSIARLKIARRKVTERRQRQATEDSSRIDAKLKVSHASLLEEHAKQLSEKDQELKEGIERERLRLEELHRARLEEMQQQFEAEMAKHNVPVAILRRRGSDSIEAMEEAILESCSTPPPSAAPLETEGPTAAGPPVLPTAVPSMGSAGVAAMPDLPSAGMEPASQKDTPPPMPGGSPPPMPGAGPPPMPGAAPLPMPGKQ